MSKHFVVKKTFIVFLIFINSVYCRINIKLTNLECKSLDKEILEFRQCSLKAIKRDLAEISIYIQLILKPVDNIAIEVSLTRRGDDKKKSLYHSRIDGCKFMRNKRRNLLAEIFFQFFGVAKYSNANHTCPYDHDLILRNAQVDTKPLSFFSISHGEYTFANLYYTQGRPSGEINLSFLVS